MMDVEIGDSWKRVQPADALGAKRNKSFFNTTGPSNLSSSNIDDFFLPGCHTTLQRGRTPKDLPLDRERGGSENSDSFQSYDYDDVESDELNMGRNYTANKDMSYFTRQSQYKTGRDLRLAPVLLHVLQQ